MTVCNVWEIYKDAFGVGVGIGSLAGFLLGYWAAWGKR